MLLQPVQDRNGRGAVARVKGLPFPWRGLNLRDRLEETSVEYASVLDNFVPENGEGTLRNGFSAHASGLPVADVESLMVYSSGAAGKLFAACDGSIFDATATGAVGAADVSGLGSDRWIDTMFSTTSNTYLVIANGTDAVLNFDGASWTTPVITGVAAADLSYVAAHKGRLWFIEKNSLNAWYLATNAIAGAATKFPLGALCKHGGSLVAMSAWSQDSGEGQDDFLVLVTSNGEVLIYAGTDPASDYQLVGIFKADRPLGNRCLAKFGGDLILLTKSGPVPCSELMSADDPRDNGFAELVRAAFVQAGISHGPNFGWQVFHYAARGWVMFNVPAIGEGEIAQQYCNNDGAWFRLRQQPAKCFAELDGNLFFGAVGAVYRSDNPTANGDDGAPIVGDVQWAWSRFGTAAKKRFTMARPHLLSDVLPAPFIEMRVDYANFSPSNAPTITQGSGAEWDISEWDETAWADARAAFTPWIGLFGVGTVGALRLQIRKEVSSEFRIQSCEIVFETGGIL